MVVVVMMIVTDGGGCDDDGDFVGSKRGNGFSNFLPERSFSILRSLDQIMLKLIDLFISCL